jgi:hypothetical protein
MPDEAIDGAFERGLLDEAGVGLTALKNSPPAPSMESRDDGSAQRASLATAIRAMARRPVPRRVLC